jgi:membrane fusion protein, multidrug efflux system
MPDLLTKVRQQPAWIALLIFILLSAWVLSGMLAAEPEKVELDKHKATPIPKVRVTHMSADKVSRVVTLYGRTEPDRMTTLRSEVQSKVAEIFAQEGQRVTKGQKILKMDKNDLQQRLISAKATLKQREIELDGAKSLGKQGYQSQANLAQAQANVESALAAVEGLQLALTHTEILAPFDGILNERYVEVGDLLREGDKIAMVVDLDPLIVTANVTENNVQQLELDQLASGRMVSGQTLAGKIRYISSVSNIGTNTFKIEVAVDNAEHKYVSGMSTELTIPLQQTWAIKVTPAVMALDESGSIGVKTVEQGIVKFVPIDMIKSDSQGVWLAGMGQQADVITLGQGFVRDGDKVEVSFAQDGVTLVNE